MFDSLGHRRTRMRSLFTCLARPSLILLSLSTAVLTAACVDPHQHSSALLGHMRAILENDKLGDRAFVEKMLDIRIDDPKSPSTSYPDYHNIDWRVTGWLARNDPKVAAISYSVATGGVSNYKFFLALGLQQVPCVTMKSVVDAFSGSGWSFHAWLRHTPDSYEPDQQLGDALFKQFGGVTVYFQTKEARCADGAALYRNH
jgi:hypothetical protein